MNFVEFLDMYMPVQEIPVLLWLPIVVFVTGMLTAGIPIQSLKENQLPPFPTRAQLLSHRKLRNANLHRLILGMIVCPLSVSTYFALMLSHGYFIPYEGGVKYNK